jgi:hypothetical protein
MYVMVMLAAALAFGLMFVGCDDGNDEDGGSTDNFTKVDYTITDTKNGDVVQDFGGGKLYTKIPYTVYTYKDDGHKEVSFNYNPASFTEDPGVVAWVDLPKSYEGLVRITLASEMKFTGAEKGALAWGVNDSGYSKINPEGSNAGTAGLDEWVGRNGEKDISITGLTVEQKILYIDFGWDSTENTADKTAKKYYLKDFSYTLKKIEAATTVLQDFENITIADISWSGWEDGNSVRTVETDHTNYVKGVFTNYNAGIVFPVDLGTHTVSEFTDVYFKANFGSNWKDGYVALATDKTDLEKNICDNAAGNQIAGGIGSYNWYQGSTNEWVEFTPPFHYGADADDTQKTTLGALTGQIYVAVVWSDNAGSISVDDFGFIGKGVFDFSDADWAVPAAE